MVKKLLITGGSGIVGMRLTEILLENDYEVVHLGRSDRGIPGVETFVWDIKKEILPAEAFEGVDAIIHLAGATVSEKWTKAYKKVILDSRVDSIRLIHKTLSQINHQVQVFVSSSGTNIYPDEQPQKVFVESDPPDDKFLATVCVAWEKEAHTLKSLGIRTVCLRTGMVLSPKGGALEKLVLPIKLGVGSPVGTGRQFISWVHIDDLAAAYLFMVENNHEGDYNVTSSNPLTNREFAKAIAKTLKRPFFFPNVPSFLVRFLFGEMSTIVLNGVNVSNQKIKAIGFKFKFEHIQDALKNLLK